MEKTSTKHKAKYKVGDYVTSYNKVIRQVVVVIDDGTVPIYGVRNPRTWADIQWDTEYELNDEGAEKVIPDFALYDTLQAGDMLHMGHSEDRPYIHILARLGNAVMMSSVPHKGKLKQVTKLSEQLKELTDGAIDPLGDMDEQEKSEMRKAGSTTHTAKQATIWQTTDLLCLMNWPIVRE